MFTLKNSTLLHLRTYHLMRTDAFALRHIGPRESDLNHMFKTIGVETFDQLIYETIPENIRLKNDLQLEPAMTEYEYSQHIHELGKKNKIFKYYFILKKFIILSFKDTLFFLNICWYSITSIASLIDTGVPRLILSDKSSNLLSFNVFLNSVFIFVYF